MSDKYTTFGADAFEGGFLNIGDHRDGKDRQDGQDRPGDVEGLKAENSFLRRRLERYRMAERKWERERKRLQEVSVLFETIFDAIPDIIGVLDPYRRVIRYNRAGYRFMNKRPDEVIGKRCFQLFGLDAPCDVCAAKLSIEQGRAVQLEKYIDAKGIWMDVRVYPVFDARGNLVQVVEHLRDITEGRRAEAALKASEEKYRLLVEHANEGIFIHQAEKVRFANQKARKMAAALDVRSSRSEQLLRCVHPEDIKGRRQSLVRRLEGENRHPEPVTLRLMDKDGSVIWVEVNTVNIQWQGKPGTLNFVRDVTRQKELESRFRDAQRMESIGTLAGGIAHDFNNLLMGIQGNICLMQLDMDKDHPHRDKLRTIEECIANGANLTKQLLGFARGGKYSVSPQNINEVVRRCARLFERTYKDLKIHVNFKKAIWAVEINRGQIEQVMLNLFLNAWQAMESSGDLYLKTDNVRLDYEKVHPYGLKPGKYVEITVADNGCGMDEGTKQRIFEPFFTTQPPGRGTGLGLSSVFGIIKNHRGLIAAESELGKGSTFRIYLPASAEKPRGDHREALTVKSGKETILLVDDEDYVLEVGRLMLKGLGYRIYTANCGLAALDVYKKHHVEIDLVILDLIMPDFDGAAVLERLREIDQNVKVLLASGYDAASKAEVLLESGCLGFIQKPFNLNRLSAVVREALDDDL